MQDTNVRHREYESLPKRLVAYHKFEIECAPQMGGAAGVMEREQYTLVTGIKDGLWMHAVPRCGNHPSIDSAGPSAAA